MVSKPLSIIACIATLTAFAVLFSGSPVIENISADYLHRSLQKASLSFAGARAINALVSVAQEVRAGGSVKLFGTGGSAGIAPLAWLDPLNDLVERFSLIMLASCISLGIQIFLNEAMPRLTLLALLPIAGALMTASLLLRATGQGAGRQVYRAGAKLLLATTLLLVMIPTMAGINHLTYTLFLADTYESAATSLQKDTRAVSRESENLDVKTTIAVLKAKMSRLKDKAEHIIDNILDIIIVFVIETMVLPLVLLWIFLRLITGLLGSPTPLPFESFFMVDPAPRIGYDRR